MKTRYLLLGMTAAAVLTGCNRETIDTASPPPAAASESLADQERVKFIAMMDRQRADFDAKINELAAKNADLKGDAKADADKAVAELRVQRDELNKQYDQLKSAHGDAWDKTKASFQSGWDSLQTSYDKTRAKIAGTNP